MMFRFHRAVAAAFCLWAVSARAADYPPPTTNDFTIKDFHFQSGETLPELRIHYLTFGRPETNSKGIVDNAVLILHGTTGSSSQFLSRLFANELYGQGQLLDVTKYFLVIPDNIGHGKSSKPSDGLHAHFPNYGYHDMIEAQYRLLTDGLGVNHLRLCMGTSMGGMHTWLWGELHPDFMDALMPLGSLPMQISGRNRVWRRLIIDAIRNSPDWQDGDYTNQPSGFRTAIEMSWLMGENPVMRLKEAPTLHAADEAIDKDVARSMSRSDANDHMYAFAASHDYDPNPDLEKITAPLLAINSADDLINPPELGVLEHEIKRVKNGQAIVLPVSSQTVGHGSHTKAVLWKDYLADFLRKTEPQ